MLPARVVRFPPARSDTGTKVITDPPLLPPLSEVLSPPESSGGTAVAEPPPPSVPPGEPPSGSLPPGAPPPAPPPDDPTRVDWKQFFLDNLPLIDAVIRQACRKARASAEEQEEFQSEMHVKLIDDGYAVLRRRNGEASLRGFLTSVTSNAFKDFRDRHWGKFHPSKAAKAFKAIGRRFEQLTMREGYEFDTAVHILKINYGVTLSRDELWAMYLRFPVRVNRRPAPCDGLDLRDGGLTPEEALDARRVADRRAHALATLARVLREFPIRERLIVKLLYDGVKQVDIARRLGEKEKGFHARCQALLARVRRRLEEEGVDPRDLGF